MGSASHGDHGRHTAFLPERKVAGTIQSIKVLKKNWPDVTLHQGSDGYVGKNDFAGEGGSSATVQRMLNPKEQIL